ncbi:hypothetical protein ACH49_26985 [Streptomyces leeuwenhoekii]|uniref:Uncharacterized protein n=1 Tax=Streptomyces leeuwenhoekii TaxID=1437453 RepID=A0ABR5HRS2_STRLW|nr:hypothetical protein ACH49_26985 [Streptomyces leeuwenhoekii]
MPSAASSRQTAPKSTGSRTQRRQYSASVMDTGPMAWAGIEEWRGTVAGRGARPASSSAIGGRISSMCGVCADRPRRSFRARMPSAASSASRSATASGYPETTTSCNPLTAAIQIRSGHDASRTAASPSGRLTQAMSPRPTRPARWRVQEAATRAPSESESTPATHAAAHSPMLWPTMAAGRTP